MFALEIFFALLGFGLAVTFYVLHLREQLGRLSLDDARALGLPVTKIASASDGRVRIVGTVLPTEPNVFSYFDRVPCVARRLELRSDVGTDYEIGLTGVRAVTVTQVERELKVFPFEVDDGTGRIAIDPRNARFDFEIAGGEEGGAIVEHRIRVGERVAIVGIVKVDRENTYRDPANTSRVRLTGPTLVSWRSDAEFLPRLRVPKAVIVWLAIAITASGVVVSQQRERAARRRRWEQAWGRSERSRHEFDRRNER